MESWRKDRKTKTKMHRFAFTTRCEAIAQLYKRTSKCEKIKKKKRKKMYALLFAAISVPYVSVLDVFVCCEFGYIFVVILVFTLVVFVRYIPLWMFGGYFGCFFNIQLCGQTKKPITINNPYSTCKCN